MDPAEVSADPRHTEQWRTWLRVIAHFHRQEFYALAELDKGSGMNADLARTRDETSVAADVRAMTNDALIIELIQALNHLSRWLTPIHDRTQLETSPRRSGSSVKDILLGLRDTEARIYSLMNAMATQTNPDLDRLPRIERTPLQTQSDREANALVVMSEFRRVRESSTSLLRALPDTAWGRSGFSRTARDWTIRELAEFLAVNDWKRLSEIDQLLAQNGIRSGIAEVSQVRLEKIDEPFAPPARD